MVQDETNVINQMFDLAQAGSLQRLSKSDCVSGHDTASDVTDSVYHGRWKSPNGIPLSPNPWSIRYTHHHRHGQTTLAHLKGTFLVSVEAILALRRMPYSATTIVKIQSNPSAS